MYNTTLIIGTFGLLAVSFVLTWLFRIEITKESINGPNLWGRFLTIPLTEGLISTKAGIPGYRYLKISKKGEGSIWIIMPISNESELIAKLEEYSKKNP